jgi:AcrR family transcriptional regulator
MADSSMKQSGSPREQEQVATVAAGDFDGWRRRVLARSLEQATQRSLDRGQVFIDAAIQLLRRSGSDGFTMQEVGDLAGQSVRTFYQHFAGKDDLLLAVFEEEVRRHAAVLRDEVMRHDDPIDRIAAFMVAGASTPVEGDANSSALLRYRIELSLTHPADLAHVQAPVVGLARQLVADAVAKGMLAECDADGAAYVLVTLKTAVLHTRILGNELGVGHPEPAQLARFCLQGLGAKAPAAAASFEATVRGD